MASPFKKSYHLIETPRLGNQFLEDSALKNALKYLLSPTDYQKISASLEEYGQRVIGNADLAIFGRDAERNPAYLVQYDAWGNRIDRIHTAHGYSEMKKVTAREQLASAPHLRTYGDNSRVWQFSVIHLLSGAQGVNYTCNTGMTDGAMAVLTEALADVNVPQESKRVAAEVLRAMKSSDPNEFLDSGQWMTERTGGSDVRGSETIAIPNKETGRYLLHGFKFFTSGTNSDVALALARIQNSLDEKKSSAPLSLFLLRLRDTNGNLQNILVHKMKKKMGTLAMPTVELELCGTPAWLVSAPGHGVSRIAPLLNISRVGVSFFATGTMRRAIAIVRDYSMRRSVLGHLLANQPLQMAVVAPLQVTYAGCLLLALRAGQLLGLSERADSPHRVEHARSLIRVVAPLSKLYPCKIALAVLAEAMEAMGGTGYMEDSSLPQLYRDEQAVAIWEGTTNVCSLDVVRAIQTRPVSFTAFQREMTEIRSRVANHPKVVQSPLATRAANALEQVRCAERHIEQFVARVSSGARTSPPTWLIDVRNLTYSMARSYITLLLLDQAVSLRESELDQAENSLLLTAVRFCEHHPPCLLSDASEDQMRERAREDFQLAMCVDAKGKPTGVGDLTSAGSSRCKL